MNVAKFSVITRPISLVVSFCVFGTPLPLPALQNDELPTRAPS